MAHAAGFNQGIGASAAGLPEYVAGAPNWLVSNDAGFVTGQIIHCDGGWTRSGA